MSPVAFAPDRSVWAPTLSDFMRRDGTTSLNEIPTSTISIPSSSATSSKAKTNPFFELLSFFGIYFSVLLGFIPIMFLIMVGAVTIRACLNGRQKVKAHINRKKRAVEERSPSPIPLETLNPAPTDYMDNLSPYQSDAPPSYPPTTSKGTYAK